MPFIGVQPASALLTSADIQDGQITTAKVADDAITGAKIENNPTIAGTLNASAGLTTPSGHVIQYQRARTASNLGTVTGTSYAKLSSSLDVTITPKFATSKLIIHSVCHVYINTNAYPTCYYAFYRDGSVISEHNQSYGGGYVQVNTGQIGGFIPYIYAEDTANNTNSTTFSLYVKSQTSGNNSSFTESLNRWVGVMEVAQ